MTKSTKIRFAIFQILIEIYKNNKNFDDLFEIKIREYNLNDEQKSFVFNVCLNSMRYGIHSRIILNKFIKKKLKISQYILLSSAITQMLYLNIKPYAVVNETVEVAKRIKLYPAFINGILKKISNNSKDLKNNINITLKDLPIWLKKEIDKNQNIDLKKFLTTFFFEPSLHLVFKSKNDLSNFKEDYDISTNKSVFIKSEKKVNELSNFNKGQWWIQNFSSMLPLELADDLKNKSVLDLCAAPGGKAFQVLSHNNNITLNDISRKRIQKLKQNLFRLNFNPKITNIDALKFPSNRKYDLVILDSPCSAVGTIRSNPEILFKKNKPNLKKLSLLQEKLLEKASTLVNSQGILVYMVCSFLHIETILPIEKFLEKNKNFSIVKYNYKNRDLNIKHLIDSRGYFLSAPTLYNGKKIDGFFSIQLINND